uniref:Uncharacterized protein n=1 Tax=Fagus sylvatica TaxID=28930 RepID=A0A2N9EZV7_FAGSY
MAKSSSNIDPCSSATQIIEALPAFSTYHSAVFLLHAPTPAPTKIGLGAVRCVLVLTAVDTQPMVVVAALLVEIVVADLLVEISDGGEISKNKRTSRYGSVLRRVENSNAAGRTVPVGFFFLLADYGDRQLGYRFVGRHGSVPSVPSVPAVLLSPLLVRIPKLPLLLPPHCLDVWLIFLPCWIYVLWVHWLIPLMVVGTSPNEDVLHGVSLSYNDFIKQVKGSRRLTRYLQGRMLFLLVLGYVDSWHTPPPNGSSATTCLLLDAWQMALLSSKCEAYSYFPSITPELHPTIESWSYGEAWMHARYPKEVPSFPTYFKLFSDSSRRRSPEEFMPFEARRYGFEDFHQFSSQGFFRGDAAWGTCLQSRGLGGHQGVALHSCCTSLQVLVSSTWRAMWLPNLFSKSLILGKKLVVTLSSQKFATAELSRKQKKVSSFRLLFSNFQPPQSKGLILQPNAKFMRLKKSTLLSPLMVLNLLGKKLFKTVAKKSSAKKAKVVEVVPDSSIIEVESLEEELDDTATLSNLPRLRLRMLRGSILEAEMEKKRQANKAEEERIAEIEKMLLSQLLRLGPRSRLRASSIEVAAPLVSIPFDVAQ